MYWAVRNQKMEGGSLLNVVVRKDTAFIIQLLSGIDQSLQIVRNARRALNLGLDIADGVPGTDIKGNGLSSRKMD